MSNGEPAPTDPGDAKPGRNEFRVETVQYSLQPIIWKKDVPTPLRDGANPSANVFRPTDDGA